MEFWVFLHLLCNHPVLGVDVSKLSTLITRPKNAVPPIQTKIQWNDGYSTFYQFNLVSVDSVGTSTPNSDGHFNQPAVGVDVVNAVNTYQMSKNR